MYLLANLQLTEHTVLIYITNYIRNLCISKINKPVVYGNMVLCFKKEAQCFYRLQVRSCLPPFERNLCIYIYRCVQ